MKSFEIEVQLEADEFIDWLDENVIDVPVLYEDRVIDQTYVALERIAHEDEAVESRSFMLDGRLHFYREGIRRYLGLPDLGQVKFDVVPLENETSRVVVTYDPNPYMLKRMKQLRSQMQDELTQPQADEAEEVAAVIEPAAFRRGGPAGPSDEEKHAIVRGWQMAQGRQTQEVYAQLQGISASTLRRYKRELEGKDMI